MRRFWKFVRFSSTESDMVKEDGVRLDRQRAALVNFQRGTKESSN